MSEDEERARVVEVARSFIGTRYHANGKLKGVGVDCGTLLTLTFEEAGVRSPIVLADYSPQFHMHSVEPRYENELTKHGAHEVEECRIGDIALYFQGKQFAHGAIVSQVSPLRIIHAYAPSRCVVEGAESEFALIAHQPKKFYSAW
jgi:hypothetical protein